VQGRDNNIVTCENAASKNKASMWNTYWKTCNLANIITYRGEVQEIVHNSH
jgi:hypothetical protein